MGLWRLGALQLKRASGILGKQPFWATSRPGAFWNQILGLWLLGALQLKSAFWDHWKRTVLGHILARSLLEPDFGTFVAWSPAIKKCLLGSLEKNRFGQNPGQEPFWGCPEGLAVCGTGFPSAFVVWDGGSCAASSSGLNERVYGTNEK